MRWLLIPLIPLYLVALHYALGLALVVGVPVLLAAQAWRDWRAGRRARLAE